MKILYYLKHLIAPQLAMSQAETLCQNVGISKCYYKNNYLPVDIPFSRCYVH